MKRVRKYRVWDNEENKYFETIYEGYAGRILDLTITLSGEIMRRTLTHPAEHESLYPNRYEIEDWIGEIDKNGVDIYENDMIEHPAFYGYVLFENGAFSISSNANTQLCNCKQPMAYHDFSEMSVIGNVRQNPELLEQL